MKQLWPKVKLILPYFSFWLLTLFIVVTLSIRYLPFTPTFPYYGDLSSYSRSLASFAHFDGIHYLRLIGKGYDDTGSQAFFPVYPLLIKTLSLGFFDPLILSMAFNIIFLFVSIYLIALQLKLVQVKKFIWLFLSFPASFFLICLYTESFFVLLVTLFFYLLRSKHYFFAALIAGIASGTRVVGVFLSLSLLMELIRNRRQLIESVLLFLIAVSGLLGYLYFLFVRFGDPLMFIHVQSMFGASRSDGQIILLPQVVYRYLRIILTVAPTSLLFIRAIWELITFLLSLLLLYIYRHKLSLSTLIFCLSAIIFPTLSGTLSSFPRYLLVCVPLFIALSQQLSYRQLYLTVAIQYGILITAFSLFVQGIFIA